ncbi:hypothetical protein AAVH_16400 [Aphelenchoides avenae]|nr:hypothetical protein AAVH_25955 [Aphelenchus avenae]KAH7716208.1 hypothetical protein AAVH_16400 [Aphelenchus avenae]
MNPVLFYEALFFSSRDDLECLQLLSRTLRDMIVYSSNVLPLRPICHVWMNHESSMTNKIRIQKCAAGGGVEHDYYEASILDGDFAETFRRLQHTSIHNFSVGFRDSPFLRYWKAQEAADFVVIWICFRSRETTDYDTFDSIVNHLRPRITGVAIISWCEDGYNSKALKLLARDSVLNHLQTCRLHAPGFPNYEMWYSDSPPASEIPANNEPPGIGLMASNVAAEIDGFIESFVRDGCTNKKLKSVGIKWNDPSHAPKQLSKPIDADVPLPRMYMLEAIVRATHRVTQCEVYSFVCSKQHQLMEVHKWTIEHEDEDRRRTTTLLQCRVKDL